MDHSPLNGRPVLLDQHGRPMRKPDGDARPAGIALPHGWTFISRYAGASYTYWHHFFDEALRHAREDAEAMRRDSYLMSLVQERQMAVTGLNWHLEVPDEKDRRQMRVKDGLTKLVRGIPFLRRMLVWWSDALWYGKYGVQVEFKWTAFPEELPTRQPKGPASPPGMPPGQPAAPPGPGGAAGVEPKKGRRVRHRGLTVAQAWPVNGDKIGHQYDHTPYVLVNGAMAGDLPNAEIITTPLGMGLSLRGSWRERFIIHKHLQEDVDYFSSDAAEAIHGVGIRSRAFWNYFLRMQWLSNVTDFFDRVGLGLTLWKYPQGDPVARAAAEKAALEQQSRANLLVPVPEGAATGKGAAHGVERVEVPTSGADALGKLIELLDRYLERYIVGQEGSSKGSSSGLGNEASAEFQKDCVPVEGCEILTRDGFKAPQAVAVGEEVLAYDAESDTCRWTPLLAKTFYTDAAVSRLTSGTPGQRNHFEAICTSDHSWAVERATYLSDRRTVPTDQAIIAGPRGGLRTVARERLLVKAHSIGSRHNLILAAPEVETQDSLLTADEAAVLGWAVTDGTIQQYRNGQFGRLGISQSKELHFAAIRELMGRLQPQCREHVSAARQRTFPNGRTYATKPQHWWYLSAARTRNLLGRCGYQGRHSLPGIVTRLSPAARRAMLDAMMAAEADAIGRFANRDASVMAAFEILCALEGVATGPLSRRPTCMLKTKKRRRTVAGDYLRLEEAGRCDIWCPTTRYGTWVMRQNGRVMITGNTKTKIATQDAAFLAETITGSDREPGLINTIQRYTYPWADFPVSFVFDVERGESEKKLASAKSLVDMGLKLKADEVRAAGGFSKPADGDELVEAPAQGPGGPGGPGGGDNPLAALMGGGPPAGGPGGGGPGQPPPPGGGPPADGGGGADGGGDLLQALRASRRGASVRYHRLRRLVDDLRAAGQLDLARAVVREYHHRTGGRR